MPSTCCACPVFGFVVVKRLGAAPKSRSGPQRHCDENTSARRVRIAHAILPSLSRTATIESKWLSGPDSSQPVSSGVMQTPGGAEKLFAVPKYNSPRFVSTTGDEPQTPLPL